MTFDESDELLLKVALQKAAEEAKQGHVFDFWPQLSNGEKKTLLTSLVNLNFSKVNHCYERAMKVVNSQKKPIIESIPAEKCATVTEATAEKLAKWRTIGLRAIAAQKVAVLLLAGGQGTRLGSSQPKGMFDIGLPSKKSLFQLQVERIVRLQRMCGNKVIPFYIMTSQDTNDATKRFFSANNYFGLSSENVIFFNQNKLPCLTTNGKIILKTKCSIAEAPDGNGGTSGVLENMKQRGVQHIHAYCVDNVLVRVADPCFIGYSIAANVESAVKVVRKTEPTESVGIVCQINGRFGVIEYSEIDPASAHAKDTDGALLYNAANICNHYFRFEFLERVAKYCQLPLHIARKHVTAMDDAPPGALNAIKLEMYIFDVLHFCTDLAVLVVERRDENKSGAHDATPEHCKNDLMRQCERFLLDAGAKVDKSESIVCEISPLVSYAGENLERYRNQSLVCPIAINDA